MQRLEVSGAVRLIYMVGR